MSKYQFSVIVAVALLASSFAGADNEIRYPSEYTMPPKIATTEKVESVNALAPNTDDGSVFTSDMLDDDSKTANRDDYLSGDSGDEKMAARILRRSSASVSKEPIKKVDSVVVPSKTCQCIKAPCECPNDPKVMMEE